MAYVIGERDSRMFEPRGQRISGPGRETAPVSRILRRGALLGIGAGLVYAIVRFLAERTPDTGGLRYEAQPFPMPPKPVSRPVGAAVPGSAPARGSSPETSDADRVAIDPAADGSCPLTHPIKGKLASGIYHRPGAFAYDRTRADRCYRDEAAARGDGLRAAKR